MPGRRYQCKLVECISLTPTVLSIRFKPHTNFKYREGQFVSVVIPTTQGEVRRLYSLASSFENAKKKGYELCIKLQENGIGGNFFKSMKPGDAFSIYAPYGDFRLLRPKDGRGICFICTSTGMGPIRAMIESKVFQASFRGKVICLVGVKNDKERLFQGVLESLGVEVTYCVSRGEAEGSYQGRVTDYLKGLELSIPWKKLDYYLCGNTQMIKDIEAFLTLKRGVSNRQIHKDFFTPMKSVFKQVA